MPYRLFLSALLTLAVALPAQAASPEKEVDALLAAETPPAGVVFEILRSGEKDMQGALATVQALVVKLRDRFPGLHIAVVSHGREEFALLSSNSDKYAEAHASVKKLVADDVPVHVCGTHASWRDKVPEDFPDYVDVVPQGPDQIQEYVNFGYELVVIR